MLYILNLLVTKRNERIHINKSLGDCCANVAFPFSIYKRVTDPFHVFDQLHELLGVRGRAQRFGGYFVVGGTQPAHVVVVVVVVVAAHEEKKLNTRQATSHSNR